MIERVAKAIYDAEESSNAASFQDMCNELARAAIAAMREPTEPMKLAGDYESVDKHGARNLGKTHITAIWMTMVDVALKGEF
jgi:hypothetical protein